MNVQGRYTEEREDNNGMGKGTADDDGKYCLFVVRMEPNVCFVNRKEKDREAGREGGVRFPTPSIKGSSCLFSSFVFSLTLNH